MYFSSQLNGRRGQRISMSNCYYSSHKMLFIFTKFFSPFRSLVWSLWRLKDSRFWSWQRRHAGLVFKRKARACLRVVSLSKLSKVLLFRKRNHFFTDYFRDKFRVGPCSYTIWWRLNGKNIAGKSQQRREHTHFRWIFCGKCVSLSLLLFSQLCLWILEKRCGGGAVIDIRTAALRSSALVNGHRRRRSRFLLLHVVYWIFLFYVC